MSNGKKLVTGLRILSLYVKIQDNNSVQDCAIRSSLLVLMPLKRRNGESYEEMEIFTGSVSTGKFICMW